MIEALGVFIIWAVCFGIAWALLSVTSPEDINLFKETPALLGMAVLLAPFFLFMIIAIDICLLVGYLMIFILKYIG